MHRLSLRVVLIALGLLLSASALADTSTVSFVANGHRRTVFANLGTPTAGSARYCSDCAATSPCTGAGTGAFAFRVGSAWNCTDGGSGGGGATYTALTAGDLTVANDGSNGKPFVATWPNGLVQTLGAVTSGEFTVATLPAKTIVKNVFIVLGQRDNSGATLTVSLGRSGASYNDYVVASDATTGAAASSIYGNASAERGTNNTGYDLPSYTGTTAVKIQFVTDATLDALSLSSGIVIIEYAIVP